MSRKTVSAVIGSLLAVGFALGAVQGCGSSSSSNGTNIMSACMQGCMKVVPCLADAGISETVAQCVQSCSASSSKDGGTCANESAIVMAAQACAAKTTCAELETCGATIPDCVISGSGTGGTRATGGTSGATGGTSGATGGTSGATGGTSGATGGTGGTASCAICDKAQTCCTAIEGAAACTGVSAAACTSTPAANQATIISYCQTLLNAGAALSAACK